MSSSIGWSSFGDLVHRSYVGKLRSRIIVHQTGFVFTKLSDGFFVFKGITKVLG